MKERSFRREIGVSSANGERARVSFLRMSLRKLTEVSRSREEGGISSAGSSSGTSFPLSPEIQYYVISTWIRPNGELVRFHTHVDKSNP